MAKLYTDPRMLEHRSEVWHPERPERLSAVLAHLESTGLTEHFTQGTVRPATDEELATVHDPSYLAAVREFEVRGGGRFEADTYVVPGSILAAKLAAGAAIQAVDDVMTGDGPIGVCAIRPPGHHARPRTAMGFCLYSSIAVAAAVAKQKHAIDRILIVDFDVHHGNGTQEIFYEDPAIGFLSIHRWPFYPGTGDAHETGTRRGLGTTRNLPVPLGISRTNFLSTFRSGLADLADLVKPQLILLSAGFDAHYGDPVGGLCLEVEDFESLAKAVHEVAATHAKGRLVSILEGGYDIEVLPHSFAAHLRGLGIGAGGP